jgi:hypothetical protein
MTTTRILLIILTLAFTGTCLARLELPPTQKPMIALAQAEAIGDKAIQQKHKGFFCIGARFAVLGEARQEWELIYANAKDERKYVVIDEKGRVEVLDFARVL